MSGFLLDTSVLSAFAPGKVPVPPGLATWLAERSDLLHVSTITFTEIEQGASKLRRSGGLERAARLSAWLDELSDLYGSRIIAFDQTLARAAGRLADAAIAAGRHPGFPDIAIAATALSRSMTLMTRNTRHFEPLSIAVADPFVALPP